MYLSIWAQSCCGRFVRQPTNPPPLNRNELQLSDHCCHHDHDHDHEEKVGLDDDEKNNDDDNDDDYDDNDDDASPITPLG